MKQFSGSCLLHHAFEDGVVPGEARVRDMKVVAATTGLRSYAEKIHIFYIFFFTIPSTKNATTTLGFEISKNHSSTTLGHYPVSSSPPRSNWAVVYPEISYQVSK